MINFKSITLAIVLGLSNSFVCLAEPLKKEPFIKIYTNSNTSDLDFFNPNRKVAYSQLKIHHYDHYLIQINQINS